MPTDIKLDQGDGNWLVAEGEVLKTTASDFMLDSPHRRLPGGGPHRRALVHDTADGLTINFNGDYRGGVTVMGNLVVTGDIRGGSMAAINAAITVLQSAITDLQAIDDRAARRLDRLENTMDQLVEMVGAAVVPAWTTKTEVDEGDDMGLVSPSATQLGLVVEFQFDQRNPNFGHEDVVSIAPPPGTLVRRGSTVVVTINLEG